MLLYVPKPSQILDRNRKGAFAIRHQPPDSKNEFALYIQFRLHSEQLVYFRRSNFWMPCRETHAGCENHEEYTNILRRQNAELLMLSLAVRIKRDDT